MDFPEVHNQLLDLPLPFQRTGFVFTGLIAAFAAALARNTRSIDPLNGVINLESQVSLIGQPDFSIAQWGWLDAIGLLYGIQRNLNETDPSYRSRVYGTINASHVTPQAIINFINLCFGIVVTISENFISPSYQINFPSFPDPVTLLKIAQSIVWVRPAGIPFLPLFVIRGGLFLQTCNYYRGKKLSGSYLGRPVISSNLTISPYTNNPVPLLPTTYLSDPGLTGQLVNQ